MGMMGWDGRGMMGMGYSFCPSGLGRQRYVVSRERDGE